MVSLVNILKIFVNFHLSGGGSRPRQTNQYHLGSPLSQIERVSNSGSGNYQGKTNFENFFFFQNRHPVRFDRRDSHQGVMRVGQIGYQVKDLVK